MLLGRLSDGTTLIAIELADKAWAIDGLSIVSLASGPGRAWITDLHLHLVREHASIRFYLSPHKRYLLMGAMVSDRLVSRGLFCRTVTEGHSFVSCQRLLLSERLVSAHPWAALWRVFRFFP